MITEKDIMELPQLEKQYKKVEQEVRKMDRKRVTLFHKISQLKSVTEFYEKAPIFISDPDKYDYTHTFVIKNVPDNHLMAEIYHNAHVPQDFDRWGLRIYDFNSSNVFKDRFLGAHFCKDEAVKLAKDWVIGKGLPEGIK